MKEDCELIGLEESKGAEHTQEMLADKLHSGDKDKIKACIRILRIVLCENIDFINNKFFIDFLMDKENIRIYEGILNTGEDEDSKRMKFELIWFLINLTSYQYFASEHWTILEVEGIVEHLVSLMRVDKNSDHSNIYISYLWTRTVAHILNTENYSNKYILNLGIIGIIHNNLKILESIFKGLPKDLFINYNEQIYGILCLISYNLDKPYHSQIDELIKSINLIDILSNSNVSEDLKILVIEFIYQVTWLDDFFVERLLGEVPDKILKMWEGDKEIANYGLRFMANLISHENSKFAQKILDSGWMRILTTFMYHSKPNILIEVFLSFTNLVHVYRFNDEDCEIYDRSLEILNESDSSFIIVKNDVMEFIKNLADHKYIKAIDYLVENDLFEYIIKNIETNTSNRLIRSSMFCLLYIFGLEKLPDIGHKYYSIRFNRFDGFERIDKAVELNQNYDISELWYTISREYLSGDNDIDLFGDLDEDNEDDYNQDNYRNTLCLVSPMKLEKSRSSTKFDVKLEYFLFE